MAHLPTMPESELDSRQINEAEYLADRLRPVQEKALGRMTEELSDRDALALSSAIIEASVIGFNTGFDALRVECNHVLYDEWAAVFGDE
jgi:hypothetical protein